MGPRTGLDGCGKSLHHCDSNPDRPVCGESLYRQRYPCREGSEWHFSPGLRWSRPKAGNACVFSAKVINLLAPELFFFNFSTLCI